MPYDPASRLQSHVNSISGQTPRPVEYVEIMRLARLLIEHEGSGSNYPVLYAYCNWMLHANLDRNPEALKMLGLIDAALLANATSSSMNEFLKQVANAFRLEELKLQLTGLFAAHSINGEVFSVGIGWANFLKALLHDLSDRPVLFKDSVLEGKSGPGKNTYDAIVEDHAANPGVFDAFVVEATISYNDNGKVGRPAGFYWTIMFQQQGKRSGLNGHLYSIPSA